MMSDNKGSEYERIAEKYLLDRGYDIIDKNFICRFGEIDIIVLKDGRIHFVEVKGRKNVSYGYPREFVTTSKQRKIISAAKCYFLLKKQDDMFCQFDVIEIIADSGTINFIEDAFRT